jgi:hypothetical protein
VNVLAKWTEDSLITDGWIQERPCRVIIDTGASVTIARPDLVAGLPERKPNLSYVLQTASGETIPVMREAHVELTLGRRPVRIWMLVADITDELILGLDVLRACNASVDVGRRVLRIGREVSLCNRRARPRSSRLTLLDDEVIPARCERVVLARPDATMKAASALVEPSMKAPPKGLYIASTLVEVRERVPVRIVNVADRDQVLSKGTVVGHVEPVAWTTPVGDQETPPPAPGPCEQLRGVISDAKPNLDVKQTQVFEGLIAEFRDVFATNSDDFGRTDRVCHRIDTGDARPIRQPPRRLPLAKQA